MIKDKHPIYYVALVIVLIAIFKYYTEYNSYKAEKAVKMQEQNESKVVDVDFSSGKFMQSLSDVVHSIKEVNKEIANMPVKNKDFTTSLFVSYSKFEGKKNQVGLCANYYNIEIEGYAEDGMTLISKTQMSSLKFKEYPEFYDTLNRALTLTSKGQKIEIFTNNLTNLPLIFREEKGLKLEQSGLLMIAVTDILGVVKFNPTNIKSKIMLAVKDRARSNFTFFCKEVVDIKYSIFDTSGKTIQKEKIETITLGSAKNKKEELLEYLILNSYDGNVEATVPSSLFLKKSKLKNVIIKGNIDKS